ncbi:hypothetical protein PN36_23900 [Candidatus Thiomargarita nelsonii]|uniref:Uncharacterized protein n=1 Tax=Candidatus Thiomargarita nelsonii TaxID=1003181 RepID=A0A0A6PK96_9GAMM|nr:hypothetical protein PN36_23900 [Candidatus Thiomargarita nelsonii]
MSLKPENRGGRRPGAGRKSHWFVDGKTCLVRIPEKFRDKVIEYARLLEREEIQKSTNSLNEKAELRS